MTASDVILLLAWGAMCNVWGVLLWMQHRLRHDGTIVRPVSSAEIAAGARVTVVIPARNEETAIRGCLERVLAQDLQGLRVVVVDDRSDDATAGIVREFADRDPRVALKTIDALPDGWLGKSHALWRGTRDLDAGGWLLFLDADCRLLGRSALRSAVHEADRREAVLLTLWPRHEPGGFWEALLVPLCGAIIALWFGRSNTPSAPAFGNGQFLLMRRDEYEAIGGHAAVRRAVIEDVPLAEAARRAGLTTWAAGGRDLVSVRMYDSLSAVFRGWSRIFVGALRSPAKIALSMAWLLAGSLAPIVAMPWLLLEWMHAGADPSSRLLALSGLCATHLLLLALVSHRFWGLGRCDRRYLWLYPLSVAGVFVILADALWAMLVRRRIGWRTTSYRFDRHARIIDAVPGVEGSAACRT